MAHLLRGARSTGGCDRLGRTGRSLLAEHGLLERLGDREADLLAGGDLDGLTGLGVPTEARLHLSQPEDAESGDLEGLALLHGLHDIVGQCAQEIVGLLPAHPPGFSELRHQLRLRHRGTSVGVEWCGEPGTAGPYADASADVKEVRIYQGLASHHTRRVTTFTAAMRVAADDRRPRSMPVRVVMHTAPRGGALRASRAASQSRRHSRTNRADSPGPSCAGAGFAARYCWRIGDFRGTRIAGREHAPCRDEA